MYSDRSEMSVKLLVLCCVLVDQGWTTASVNTYYMDRHCGSSLDLVSMEIQTFELQLTSGSYYHPMDCSFHVSAGRGETLTLHFTSENIAYSVNCITDFLDVHDGNSLQSPTIAGLKYHLCGYDTPSGVYDTNGRYLTLHFRSLTTLGSGFNITVTRNKNG